MSMFSSITSFISSSISSLPFKLTHDGAELVHPSQSVAQGGGIWKHQSGMRVAPGMGGALTSAAGEPVSVFTFDKRVGSADQLHLARNALQRIKTLRHPNIIKYIDSVDLPTHLHILTEPVTPLILKPIALSNEMAQLTASLGLHQIVSTISWLNNEAKIVHSNVHPGSLYTTESGDWKLFGFDLSFKGTDPLPDAILLGRNSGILPVQYKAPELIKNASSNAPPSVLHATDAWSLACLIFHLFNSNFSSPQQLAQTGTIPPSLVGDYKKLLATNPANRLNPKALLDSSFFRNDLVSSVEFLDQLALKSAQEKDAFFVHFATGFTSSETKYPKTFCRGKILPLLTKSLDYGSGLTTSFSAILSAVLKIGSSSLNEHEFSVLVLPSVLKLFASNERQIRVHLLQHLGEFATFLTEGLVNDSIFTPILTGFSDSNAILRELTVKSLLHLAPKLNPNNMDQALRMLAKLQTDSEPAIRTNTGYCIAKIATFLSPALQEKVLFPAFSKCLRDPFPPARVAGLMSFLATLELHKPVDVARKILPTIAPCLADDVREVREAALKLLEACTARMSAFHAHLRQQQEAAIAANPNAMGSHQQTQLSPNAAPADGAAGLAGSAGAVLGSLGSWAASTVASTVRSKMSNADANPPPKSLQSGGSSNAGSNLNSASSAGRSYGNSSTPYAASSSSSSVLAAAASGASPAASGSSFDNDDFFNDFSSSDRPGDNGEAGSDSDDGMVPVAVALSTKKPAAAAGRKSSGAAAAESKEKKKSILSGGSKASAFAISPPPSAAAAPASSSLDSWSFDMDDAAPASSSSSSKHQSVVDDFDDWGSSVSSISTKPAAAAKPASSLHAKKSSDADLLSFNSPPPAAAAAAHKKTPSVAASSDPFAALSLGSSSSGASPKPPQSSPAGGSGGMSLKPKASPLSVKPVGAATGAGAKKAGGEVDFWSDF